MFTDLNLKAVYSSDKDNISEDFYLPVLENAVKFDRTSAYFSAKALALYAKGIENFGAKGHKYRLVISKDISKEDYEEIKRGYGLKEALRRELINSLDETLTIEEEQSISNLAYFIAKDIVEIKIAFKFTGIFHDKTGLLEDEKGNVICFKGSNNETEAANKRNYESFQLMCSWLDCEGFYQAGIKQAKEDFERLWSNNFPEIYVAEIEETVLSELMSHNRNCIITEAALLEKNTFVLDYFNQLLLHMNVENPSSFVNSAFYKMKLKYYVDRVEEKTIYFKSNLKYPEFQRINNVLSDRIENFGHKYKMTNRLKDYIDERNIYIKSRAKLGIELKTDASNLQNQYLQFKEVVNSKMTRELREKQMKDAFFMYLMKKSANFSVPGSGKTSSALAVYAYLKNSGLVNKIIMVGPKNAFLSWKDEFDFCFKGKEPLNVFDIHDNAFRTVDEKKDYLNFDSGNCTLFLFNYEALPNYVEEISRLVSNKALLVFDEVHKVKRIDGTYANYALKIAEKSRFTIAMTGTPLPNSYKDIFNVLNILYGDEYNEFFNFSIFNLTNPNKEEIEIINDKIQPFFCRTSKKELNVPEANEDILCDCMASEAEQKIFNILKSKYKNDHLTLMIRVLQLESNPRMILQRVELREFAKILDISGDIRGIDFVDASEDLIENINKIEITTKKQKCLNLVEKLTAENKSVIIWCIFRDTISSFESELKRRGILAKSIYGETEQSYRGEILKDFKEEKFQVLITNPHTLAESISLHSVCHDSIYFEYSYNLVHLLQSKDRINRLGLSSNQYTQYYFLNQYYQGSNSTFSLNNKIYERLKEKEITMLNAIDKEILEPVYTSEEDLALIFKGL